MPTINVNDINLYYEVHGQGEPLVLIHGMTLDCTAWEPQLADFCKQYQVIVFDNRGVGRSDAPNGDYSTDSMTKDTVALLDALKIDSAHVIGVSMGGMIAQKLAIQYPQRVKSLILVSSTAKMPPFGKHVMQVWLRMLEEKVESETILREQLSWLFTERFFEDPVQIDAVVKTVLNHPHAQPVNGFKGQIAALLEHDTSAQLNQIPVSTLVLAGKEEKVLSLKSFEALSAGIPKSQLSLLEGGGHSFFMEIPKSFNRAVLAFLKQVTA